MSEVVSLEHLQKFLSSHFDVPPARVTTSARLVEDLELDSLDAVDLVVRLEQETGVEIVEAELKEMVTVEDVLRLLREKLRPDPGDQP